MGGRGSKGHRSKLSLSQELGDQQQDPILPPEATATPDEPTEPEAPQPPEQTPEPTPPTEQATEPLPAPVLTAEQRAHKRIERRIEDAYQELAVTQRDWVALVDLRNHLFGTGLSKERIDQVLKAMSRDGRLHFAPDSNRKALRQQDHAAAIRVGGEDQHLIAIEPPPNPEGQP